MKVLYRLTAESREREIQVSLNREQRNWRNTFQQNELKEKPLQIKAGLSKQPPCKEKTPLCPCAGLCC
jgi:hypothetical protein